MKKTHFPTEVVSSRKNDHEIPCYIFFCEKKTGVVQFKTELSEGTDGELERIASTFAMQCFVHGRDPEDFLILVPAGRPFTERLASRACELVEGGRTIPVQASLSPRQTEIMHALLRNMANKEIAAKLNITIRTVKFHVSALLNKFGVQSRIELAKRATVLLHPSASSELCLGVDGIEKKSAANLAVVSVAVKAPLPLERAARNERFLGQVLTA